MILYAVVVVAGVCVWFFPQPILEGLLNWILISKTPARKSTIVVEIVFLVTQAFKAELKAEPDFRYANMVKFKYTNFSNIRRNPILGTQTCLSSSNIL